MRAEHVLPLLGLPDRETWRRLRRDREVWVQRYTTALTDGDEALRQAAADALALIDTSERTLRRAVGAPVHGTTFQESPLPWVRRGRS